MLHPKKNKVDILSALSEMEQNSLRPMLYGSGQFISFLETVTGGKIECLILKERDKIYGVLPYLRKEVETRNCSVINSLPWYGSHGGCILAKGIDHQSEINARTVLLKGYFNQVKNPNVGFATLITTHDEEKKADSLYEEVLKPNNIEIRNGQITNLPASNSNPEKLLFEMVNQKTRNLIRKSLKQGFREVSEKEPWMWDFLYETHKENMDAIGGKAKPFSHFNAMYKHLDKKKIKLSVATLQDKPVAALLLVKHGKWVEYITPVIKKEYRSFQPLSFLIWSAMLLAVKEGYCYWNWGGTWQNQASLHHFKKSWGAVDCKYKYYCHSNESYHYLLKKYGVEMCPYFYISPPI